MKAVLTGCLAVALFALGVSIGRAHDRGTTVLHVQVNSAEHEAQEGYFSLGEQATVMVKPGSDLFRFLSRHRGQTVKIVLTQNHDRELSRIDR